MSLTFPSPEFNEAVAAVCDGLATEEQALALNHLLRTNPAARDEYILRLELHSRLASEPDLFAGQEGDGSASRTADSLGASIPLRIPKRAVRTSQLGWAIALAACLTLVAIGFWSRSPAQPVSESEPTSKAIAMLNRTADAQWEQTRGVPRLNAPLEPGPLRLEAGLAQIVFYSGTRLVIEGPAELDLVSDNEAFFRRGRIIVDVPAQAHGFRLNTPHARAVDLGTSFGVTVNDQQTSVQVFKGRVTVSSAGGQSEKSLGPGAGTLVQNNRQTMDLAADPAAFASLFSFQAKSEAAEARRFDQWRTACKRLGTDPSLLLHFDFENVPPAGWQIRNLGNPQADVPDGTIIGCQWTEGRWPEKRALEFQSVNDRMRLVMPGEFQSFTLSAWVCVKGLDRKINSLFMSDGFDPRTVHWLIRRDGVLGLTVIGSDPRNHQIVTSAPVITLEKFGLWLHLAVVLDASSQRVVHYFNGAPVSETRLKIEPPFRVGPAELGNWNAKGFPKDDPFMIRNFSGAMDEFLFFDRPLGENEIRALYTQGKPQADMTAR